LTYHALAAGRHARDGGAVSAATIRGLAGPTET
jgi:hypothetical protein